MNSLERVGLAAAGCGLVFAVGSGLHELQKTDTSLGFSDEQSAEQVCIQAGDRQDCDDAFVYEHTTGNHLRSISLDAFLLYGVAEGVLAIRRRRLVEDQR